MSADKVALVGVEDAAIMLSLSKWTLRKWISERKITTCKLGSRRLIPFTEIERIIRDGTEGPEDKEQKQDDLLSRSYLDLYSVDKEAASKNQT